MPSMVTFIHIEKAAGTTLNHILRRNHLFRHADVRPYSKDSLSVFQKRDLKTLFLMNPFTTCISGHSLYPEVLGKISGYDFQYITVLRDPLKRYVSQFAYLYSLGRIPNDFEAFLADDEYRDFQTYKLSRRYNPDQAISVLDSMTQVGVVEDFDGFLVRLSKSLGASFDPRYHRKNTTKPLLDQKAIFDKYEDEIRERNINDLIVYQHTVDKLIPNLIKEHGPEYERDVVMFKEANADCSIGFKPYLDYVYRKFYFDVATGIIRLKNGLPYTGSY